MYLWPRLRCAGPNSTATSMDRQQTAAFFQKQTAPPIDINSVPAIRQYFFQTSEGWLVINPFRKMTPSYYSWQGLNNRCFGEPRTLEGIGTVQPLSGWSVCCYTMAEWGEGGGEQQHSSAAEKTDSWQPRKVFLLFRQIYQSLFCSFCGVFSRPVGREETSWACSAAGEVFVEGVSGPTPDLSCLTQRQAGCREFFIFLRHRGRIGHNHTQKSKSFFEGALKRRVHFCTEPQFQPQ